MRRAAAWTCALAGALCLALTPLTPQGLVAEDGDPGLKLIAPDGPVLLGDWFEVLVEGDLPDSATLVWDDLPRGVRLRPGPPAVDEQGRARLPFSVSSTRQGELRLDGLSVEGVSGSRTLPALTVEVVLDLEPGRTAQVADFLAPVDVPMPPAPAWIFLTVIGAALALLLVHVVRAGRVITPAVMVTPPDVIATRALANLRSRIPRTPDEIPAFVDAVSTILRRYIEARFGLDAPDRTTEEFMAEVGRQPELTEHKGALEPFLRLCDLVKFARHRPGIDQVNDLLVTAEGFVEGTRDPGPESEAAVEVAA